MTANDNKDFIQILVKLENLISIVSQYKKEQDKIKFTLNGDGGLNDKPSLIDAVKSLQNDVKLKAAKLELDQFMSKMENIFNVQNGEIKSIFSTIENVPDFEDRLKEVERVVSRIKAITNWLMGLVAALIISVSTKYFTVPH